MVRTAAILVGLVWHTLGPALASGVLGLPEGRIVAAAKRVGAKSPDLVTWGREASALLQTLARRGGRWLMDRFAVLGHLARWWGTPWRWVPARGRLLPLGEPFWDHAGAGTRGRPPP
ncbi:MAG: hypothetical protein AB7P08_19165 [Burkholderiales bacterium]